MRAKVLVIGGILAFLSACSAGAPHAPVGLNRRPANSAETIEQLTGDRTPSPASALMDQPDRMTMLTAARTGQPRPPMIISDFDNPAGFAGLSSKAKASLIESARASGSVTIFCRGDRGSARAGQWSLLVRRGAPVRAFLIANGVQANRVRLLARSAGDFVADNRTATGRAKNRRVEIHFG